MSHRFILLIFLACAGFPTGTLSASKIVAGDVTSALGPDFIFDTAATGGGDHTAATLTRDISGYWTPGAAVILKGLGWASSSSGTVATSVTATFTDAGTDEAFNTDDDVVLAAVTDDLNFTGAAGEFVWHFDTPVTFTAAGSGLRIQLVANGGVRRKTTTGSAAADVKLSLAGSFTGGTAPPVVRTASASGNWDGSVWGGSGVNPGDTAEIGGYHTILYRGIPANQMVADLNFGQSGSASGQATLRISSGILTVNGNLNVGRFAAENDSFVRVEGGTLKVNGNALFGLNTESCDGSLEVSGGAVEIAGNLSLGGYAQGGSMLRFHNPGSSPAVKVGGKLSLDRCSLDLKYDAAYIHVPGTITTLATFGTRDGQFLNYRRGEEFNLGRHRFRLDCDPGTAAGSIRLTALADALGSSAAPNVVFILADDQGYADNPLDAHPVWAAKYPMPRVQSLAEAGARFTDAYVTGGVCHPSRCSLMTGSYQQRFGADNNLGGGGVNGMPVTQNTLPNRFRGLGYETFGIGKWHLGNSVEHHPNLMGFDQWYGMWGGSRSYYNATSEDNVFQRQMTPVFADEGSGYLTDRIGDKAVQFIDDHMQSDPGHPFFMYVSFTAVHGPNDLQFMDARFARLQNEFGLTEADYTNAPIVFGGDAAKTKLERYRLAAMTLAMDENVGKIVDKVNSAGLSPNTIFVYLSDNGGPGWASGSGGNWSYNVPLRGYKGGSTQDGSVRVPGMICWPGTIPAGQVVTAPVSSLDFMATCVNSGNPPAAARNGLDGLDLLPLLRDGTPLPADRVLTWRAGGATSAGSAARIGDWKMLVNDATGLTTLYNLRNDIDENNDLAASQPAILANLKKRFLAWETLTIPPLYGTADTEEDSGLERWAISGGLRLRNDSAPIRWLSASFREPVGSSSDFSFSFLMRASEPVGQPAGSGLWQGIGESSTRGNFIRFGISAGDPALVITEGKNGNSASVSLPSLPVDFAAATLTYTAASKTLELRTGATAVSLVLTGSYGPFTHHAMGAAAMEGELTTLRPGSASGMESETTLIQLEKDQPVRLSVGFQSDPPFWPKLERSGDLSNFVSAADALIEYRGGGRYMATAPAPVLPAEFFRFNLNTR